MEDEKIIALYWDRDQTAIAETQQKYGRYCGSIAHNIVHDAQDAEECVNDTWMRAWNSMPRERPQLLAAFLGAITRNLSLDCYRRKHSEKRGGGVMPYIYEELHDCAGGEEPLTHPSTGFWRGWTARAGLFSCADTGIWMASERLPGGLRSARAR